MTAFGTLFPLTEARLISTPTFKTEVVVGANGEEVRNRLWQDARRMFNAGFGIRTYADIDTLQGFFLVMGGRERSFLLKDYLDFQVARQEFAETIDGVETNFQLIKTYTNVVAGDYVRTITKPKAIEGSGGVTIWDNDSEVATGNYSFSSVTGIVNIPVPPISGHTLEFQIDEFYVPVRFDVDELPMELLSYWVESGADTGNVNVPDIPLIEVRSPNE